MSSQDRSSKRDLIIIFIMFGVLGFALWRSELFGPQLQDRFAFWAASTAYVYKINPYDSGQVLSLAYSIDKFRMDNELELVWGPPHIYSIIFWFSSFSFSNFLYVHFMLTVCIITFGSFLIIKSTSGFRYLFINNSLIVLTFFPFYLCLILGPVDGICYLGLVLFLYFTQSNTNSSSKYLSGLSLSLTTIKPHLLYLLYALLLADSVKNKEYRILLGMFCGIAFLVIPTFVFYPQVWHHYIQTLGNFPIRYITPTIISWIVDSLNLPQYIRFLPAIVGVFALFYLILIKRVRTTCCPIEIYSIFLSLILAPYLWTYDFILLFPAICLLIEYEKLLDKKKAYIVSTYLIVMNIGLWITARPAQYTVWYPILLFGLCLYTIKRVK